jgi:hypothetical protein
MYGPNTAYTNEVRTRRKGMHELAIHRERGNVWLKAVLHFAEGTITEYLLCECETLGKFRLTSRHVEGKVPITLVARRHGTYPANSFVRMKT